MQPREPWSQEAEQGVLGAMLIRPELIDVLSADLKPSDFFFVYNREVFEAILKLRTRAVAVDFLTVADVIGTMGDGENALAYCAELHRNTPSAANANAYARIVLERSVDRALQLAAQNVHEISTSTASVEDKIAQAHAEILGISSESSSEETVTAGSAMHSHVAELERRLELGGKIDGLSTGIPSLDAKLNGLKGGQLIVIAGRPKMGKTTLAMNIADHNALIDGRQVLAYSLEMSKQQLLDKTLASVGNIPLHVLKNGTVFDQYSNDVCRVSTMLSQSGLAYYDRKGATINRIRASARRHKMRYGLHLLLVDHIGLVDVDDARANAVARVSEVTRQLKLLAMEVDVPVIAMSQLNRQLEQRPNKRPIPSDLRDSGSIEQDADLILFVYRDEVYNEHTEYRGVAELIVGVARDVEPCTVKVRYQGKYSKFSDLADDFEPPEFPNPPPTRSYSSKSLLD